MILLSLEVKSAITDDVIRNIKFNRHGLSLIVDSTDNKVSGSNIGKTTAVKIIDLCLGAKSVSSIYKEKDTGENNVVKQFIQNNKIIAILNAEVNGRKYSFKRSLYKNGKNEINGEVQKNAKEYRKELNKIIFDNEDDKPKFRQLISKFVRLDNSNEDSLLKYLGNYCKNYEYQAIYSYLFGIDIDKSKNLDILSLNEGIDKDIEVIYRKNDVTSLDEFAVKIELIQEELEKFKNAYSQVTVIEDYSIKRKNIDNLLISINKLERISERQMLQFNLMKEKINKEKSKIFNVDHKALQKLYDETKISVEAQLKSFYELEKFHNEMVNKRIEILTESLNKIEREFISSNKKLSELRKQYENEYVTFNSQLKDKFEEKYSEFSSNKIKLLNLKNDYKYILNKKQEKELNLSLKVKESDDLHRKEQIKKNLNDYFKDLTHKIVGETFAIIMDDNNDNFPIKIIGMNGKPGAGIKKAMITCFDLAHIKLILEQNYHMPVFEIHDKLENIDLTELANIIEVSRKFEGQYVFPILSDRINQLGILEKEIVLRLSNDDKFFHIK